MSLVGLVEFGERATSTAEAFRVRSAPSPSY